MIGGKTYVVQLSFEQRERLEKLTRNGSGKAKKILHARMLLMADQDHPLGRYSDQKIARALGVHRNTVTRVRKRFCLSGEQGSLERKPREKPPTDPKLDGHGEAILLAITCSPPPRGCARWTLSLLCDELKNRKVVTSIARETVRKTLKKMNSSPGAPNATAFPNATRPASSRRWKRSWISTPRRLTLSSR